MFDSVSWPQYLNFLLIVIPIYYLLIGLLYFRKELFTLVQGKGISNEKLNMPALSRTESREDQLLEELRQIHKASRGREFPKEELMLTIIQKVQQYDNINREVISQFLA